MMCHLLLLLLRPASEAPSCVRSPPSSPRRRSRPCSGKCRRSKRSSLTGEAPILNLTQTPCSAQRDAQVASRLARRSGAPEDVVQRDRTSQHSRLASQPTSTHVTPSPNSMPCGVAFKKSNSAILAHERPITNRSQSNMPLFTSCSALAMSCADPPGSARGRLDAECTAAPTGYPTLHVTDCFRSPLTPLMRLASADCSSGNSVDSDVGVSSKCCPVRRINAIKSHTFGLVAHDAERMRLE